MKKLGTILFAFFASYGLSVATMFFMFLIILFGTLYQVEHGLYAAQVKYFDSLLVMHQVGLLIPVTPVCLVCDVLVREPLITIDALTAAVEKGIEEFRGLGAIVVAEEQGAKWMVEGALLRLGLRHVVVREGVSVRVNPNDARIVAYYANSVAHYRSGGIPTVERPNYVK